MNCNIIRDLIPLYIDQCCSEESVKTIEKHLTECNECRAVFESMNQPIKEETICRISLKSSRINDWKAAVLQSVLFFASFLVITTGVAIEASTYDLFNGFAAFNLVIPTTGFMLSLANWYFIKIYQSRKAFSNFSCLITFMLILCAGIWCGFHYERSVFDFFLDATSGTVTDFFEAVWFQATSLNCIGIFMTAALCVASKLLSNAYAKMLGKE